MIFVTVRTPTIHDKDMHINKNKVKEILDRRGMEYKELYDKAYKRYGLDLSYKGFMSLLSNRSTWKLLYAHAIADILQISYLDIFDVVDVDVEKAKREREVWKEKYQNK